MSNIPIPDPAEREKLMAELDAVDFDDLDDGFRGIAVDDAQLEKYKTIVSALFFAQKESGGKIQKIEYLKAPDPTSEYASAMIVLDKVSFFDADAKAALIMAASMSDSLTVTTNNNRVRVSFAVDNIWREAIHKGVRLQAYLLHGRCRCDLSRPPPGTYFFELLSIHVKRLAAFVLALTLGNLYALPLALQNILSLQLRKSAEYGKHKTALRGGGVDILFQTDKLHALLCQLRNY